MSIHQLFHRSLAATFVLSIAGLAFARQPPALVQAQAAAERAAVCNSAQVAPERGYRDSLVRFGTNSAPAPTQVAASGVGYRGRFEAERAPLLACNTPPHAPRLTASAW